MINTNISYLVFSCLKAQVYVHAAYGSSKDISVYQSLGLEPHQIFVIGKVSKKQQKEAVVSWYSNYNNNNHSTQDIATYIDNRVNLWQFNCLLFTTQDV